MSRTRPALLLLLVLTLPAAPALAPPGADGAIDATCVRREMDVRLAPESPTTHRLVGWLCGASPVPGQTVVIASPTGLADHSYWDWPQEPGTYSFVRHATGGRMAVFNYDRIGTGESDRPPAALVTVQSEAFVLHQIVLALRAGDLGTPFERVVLLGNSLSTFISIFEAETYRDVDGLINTGIFVGPTPVGLATLFSGFYPAQLDPKFADEDIPPGYATTMPGARDAFFHLPAADPATVALDEDLKETATAGEAATFPTWWPLTRLVDVPVLSVMGDHDVLFCSPECHEGGIEAEKERLFWGPATCFEVEIVDEAGHFLQLHAAAAVEFRSLAFDWIDRRVGRSAADPPTQPCDA